MAIGATVRTASVRPTANLPRLATGIVIGLCAAKLMLHVFTSVRHYGYFRDELYYLDLARHLDWGYVDCAPLIGVYAKVALLLGGSLAALRILPALAGTAVIAISMLIARELGGRRYAQALTGLAVLITPSVLAIDDILTMNAFEPLFWMGCMLVLIRIMRTGNSRRWLWFGVLAGLGLENKHSTVFFGFAVVLALLLTAHRREFEKPWIWIAGAIALFLFLPNLVWQVQHHFPTLEDLENVRRTHKNVVLGPGAFVWQQILTVHPILFPLWLAGAVSFFRQRWTRVLGWTFVIFFVTMFVMHGKDYYLFPIYPMMLAGGAVVCERWLAGRESTRPQTWAKAAIMAIIVAAAIPIDIIMLPVLSPEQYVAYTRAIHFAPPKAETNMESVWPQLFADQIGWEQMAKEVAAIYNSLPPEERAKTGILTGNYGEAGAIDQFGPKYGLPRAISGHQNHWYWGPPKEHYENFITLEYSRETMQRRCASFQAFQHDEPFGMGEENTEIYLCRGAKLDFEQLWPRMKHWN